ncbi:MAG: NAD(P)/FAD-dependent oxidoreductase [Candidatus Woesearchaeota archaeon]
MIAIIGAGPSGSHLAYLLAKNGFKVQVFEEKKRIGKLECTGLVSEDIKNILDVPKRLIINRIEGTRIFSPSGREFKISLAKNFVLDRVEFDLWLSERAALAGAEYYLGTRFDGWNLAGRSFLLRMRSFQGKKFTFRADYVIGADGPFSEVAKLAGIYGSRKFYTGIQVEAKLKNENEILFWPEQGGLSWIVPLNEERVLLGVAFEENAKHKFKAFCKKMLGRRQVRGLKASLIPKFSPLQPVQRGRVFLVGDAALQVKATTLGGIIPGLRSAEELSKSFMDFYNPYGYTARYLARVFPDLYASLIVRRIMDNCSNAELDELFGMLEGKKLRKLFKMKSRDSMLALGFSALLREPKLLKFARRLFTKSKAL